MSNTGLSATQTLQIRWTVSGSEIEKNGISLWCAYTGQNEESTINWGWIDAVHPDDRTLLRDLWKWASTNPHRFQTTYRVYNVDGTYHALLAKYVPLFNDGNDLRGWICWLTDITREPDTFDPSASADLMNFMNAIVAFSIDGVVVYNMEGKIKYINESARKGFELPGDVEWVGRDYYDLLEHIETYDEQNNYLPIDRRPFIRIMSGEVFTPSDGWCVIIHLPSGREKFLRITGTPVYGQANQLIGCVIIFRDITEQRQQEKRVLRTLDLLLTLVEALADLPLRGQMLTTDNTLIPPSIANLGKNMADVIAQALQCQYVSVITIEQPGDHFHLIGVSGLNPAQERQYTREINRSVLSDYFNEIARARLHANEPVLRNLVKDPYPASQSDFGIPYRLVSPMLLGGQLVGLFTIAKSDVDSEYSREEIALTMTVARLTAFCIERMSLIKEWADTRANELALQEANRHFETFLSLVSHELKTPLTTIQGNIQLALRRLNKMKAMLQEDVVEQLKRIQQPLEYANQRTRVQDRMILDLLEVTRIRANKFSFVMKRCDLAQIIHEAIADIRMSAPDRTIISMIPKDEKFPIMADTDRIGQAIRNYLLNALKYSGSEAPVEVMVQKEGTQVRVSVRDYGPGLSPEQQKKIWDRFYRAKGIEVQYGSNVSLGLGLYICQTIIAHHQGEVGVISAPNQGSTFWFTIPLASTGLSQELS